MEVSVDDHSTKGVYRFVLHLVYIIINQLSILMGIYMTVR